MFTSSLKWYLTNRPLKNCPLDQPSFDQTSVYHFEGYVSTDMALPHYLEKFKEAVAAIIKCGEQYGSYRGLR